MEVVKGIYEKGIIHPLEKLKVKGKKYVIITFLDEEEFQKTETGEDLKPIVLSQFSALEKDWNAPGMEKYDQL